MELLRVVRHSTPFCDAKILALLLQFSNLDYKSQHINSIKNKKAGSAGCF